jgi:hypothetical protein
MHRITKPGGRVLLTVPFGRYQNHGWFQQYDLTRLIRLLAAADFAVAELEFFRYQNGWSECLPRDLRDTGYGDNGARAGAGLACVHLIKPPRPI